MTDCPLAEYLKDNARSFCAELLGERHRTLCPPAGVTAELADLTGKQVVLWDIYGTVLAGRAVDLEASLKRPEAMLDSFELTAQKFGFDRVARAAADKESGHGRWLRDRYTEGIERVHRKKKAEGFPSPEVKIEEVWEQIISGLEALGYTASNERRDFLPWTAALYYEIAFQQAVFYRGAVETFLRLKKMEIRQGIVSNAQFYTPILLEILLSESTHGRVSTLSDIFEEPLVVFSYQVGRSKPDPLIFADVLGELDSQGIPRKDILYVGNDMLNDVHLASGQGLTSVLFAADRHSLDLRENDERTAELRPDALITAYNQLPFMLSGGAATAKRTLRLGLWHHHLRPGGVSSVIRDSLEALDAHGGYSKVRAGIFTDAGGAGIPPVDWAQRLNGRDSLSLRVYCLPDLAYDDRPAADKHEFLARAEKQRDLLIGLLDLEGCDESNPYVLYVHNSALGKNPYASAGLRLLAEWAQRSERPLLILMQTHDFAECHRPDRVRAWRAAAAGIPEEELAGWEFPTGPNIQHASLTSADRRRLISTGIPSGAVHVLANSVRNISPSAQTGNSILSEPLGGRPYLLAAQKVMRRKNTLEALAVLAASRRAGHDIALVVTLPAASPADRKYEELVVRAVKTSGLPAIIGLQRTLGDKTPAFEEVVAGCSAFLTTSVMEGFGQSFLEGWVAGRVVLGRRIEEPCRDFESAGIDLAHLYEHLLVDADWLPGGLEALKQAYSRALSAVRAGLGFEKQPQREFEEEFTRQKTFSRGAKTLVDFADLAPRMQAEVVCLIAAESSVAAKTLELNPWLDSMRVLISGSCRELIERNRESVLLSYGPQAKARRLRSIILAGAAAMAAGEEAGNSTTERSLRELLAETVSLQKTRLLFLDGAIGIWR